MRSDASLLAAHIAVTDTGEIQMHAVSVAEPIAALDPSPPHLLPSLKSCLDISILQLGHMDGWPDRPDPLLLLPMIPVQARQAV